MARRRRLSVAALAALLLALLAAPVAAQDIRRPQLRGTLPGIGDNDPRARMDPTEPPWRALGRVQTELGGRCTGVLVAPDRVLTAAHCLVTPRSGQFVQPGSVHFLLGYDRGGWVARARVTAFTMGAGYSAARGPIGADWALLRLERRIGAPDRILPLLREAPAPRTPVMLGGYQQDRPEVIMADTNCHVLGLARHASGHLTLVHDCAGTRGASGAPLLARTPDGRGWAVAGVLSAVAPDLALGHAVPAAAVGPVE